MVTHGFLKQLAKRELEQSAVGRFAPEPATAAGSSSNGHGPEREDEDVTIGSTPWGVVAALAAAFLLLGAVLGWALRGETDG